MIERVKAFILAQDLIKYGDKVLLAVSGGMDSMVLLKVLCELNFDVVVAHMNYQLRGEESDLDEKLVSKVCEYLKIPCFVKRVRVSEDESIQLEARRLRYTWFEQLAKEEKIDKIATAHHLNDSLETALLNLVKGTGIMGAAGIPLWNGQVVRPLLGVTKQEIEKYATDEGIEWREDASNKESKYQRNLIRNEVLPLLERINPSVANTFKSTRERMIGVKQLVLEELQKLRNQFFKVEDDSITIDLQWIQKSEKDLMLLSELLKEFGVSYVQAKDIFECELSGSQFETSTHLLFLDRKKLIVKSLDQHETLEILIKSSGEYEWGNRTILVSEVKLEEVDTKFPSNVAFLDGSKINLPIQLRSWQLGDEFQPFGMKGRKKLSDFFIDEKVPVSVKKKIPIFAHANKIIWVGGIRIDDKYKVTSQTEKVLKIEIRK